MFSFSFWSIVWVFSHILSFLSLIRFDWTCISFFRFFISCFISAIIFSFTGWLLSSFSISVSFSESRSYKFSISCSVMVSDGSFSLSLSAFNVSVCFSSGSLTFKQEVHEYFLLPFTSLAIKYRGTFLHS